MGWRSIFILSSDHIELSLDNKAIAITKAGKTAHFRVEDIDFILIDSYNFKISGRLLEVIASHNIPLVLTSSQNHFPILQLLNPYSSHHKIGSMVTAQSNLSKKDSLILWRELISNKIKSQGELLGFTEQSAILANKALNTKSTSSLLGIEGSWAKIYWANLIDENFTRVPKLYALPNDCMNNFLNYTYAIIRSRVASAISEAGMLPLFSLFHRREYNQFALADDLIEPYRWCADKLLRDTKEIKECDDLFLSKELKKIALTVLHEKVYIASQRRAFGLDEAIRIGARALRDAILQKSKEPLRDTLCIIPQ